MKGDNMERVGLPKVAVIAVEKSGFSVRNALRHQAQAQFEIRSPSVPPYGFGGAPALTRFPSAQAGTSTMRGFS